MEDFKIIYRILKAIKHYEMAEIKTLEHFTPDMLKTTKENRDRLILKLIDAGYVTGFRVVQKIDGLESPVILWETSNPSVTIKGLEYLEDNSMMKKVKETLKGIANVVPKI